MINRWYGFVLLIAWNSALAGTWQQQLESLEARIFDTPSEVATQASALLEQIQESSEPEAHAWAMDLAFTNRFEEINLQKLEPVLLRARERSDRQSELRLMIRKFVLMKGKAERAAMEAQAMAVQTLLDRAHDPLMQARFWFELAEYYGGLREVATAMEIIRKNLNLLREQHQEQSILAYVVREGLGGNFFSKADYKAALAIFSECAQFYRDHGYRYALGNVLYNKAYTLLETDTDKALPVFEEALKISESIHQDNLTAVVLYGIGTTYRRQKLKDKALPYLRRAYAISDAVHDIEFTAVTAFGIMDLDMEAGRQENIRHMLNEIEGKIPGQYLIQHEQILHWHYQLAMHTKDYQKAVKFLDQQFDAYIKRKEDEGKLQLQKISTELGLKVEEERNRALQQQNAAQALKLEQAQRFQLFTFILSALLLGILGLLLMLLKEHKKVQESQRNMRLILDNIDEGLLTVDEKGRIGVQYSRSLSKILPAAENPGGHPLDAVVFANSSLANEERAMIREIITVSMGEDRLAWEMNAENLPQEFQLGDQQETSITLRWIPIYNPAQTLVRLLLCLRDVTEKRQLELAYGHQKRHLKALPETLQDMLRADPERVEALLANTDQVLQNVKIKPDRLAILRQLHTQKGAARTLGLKALSHELHDLESSLQANTQRTGLDGPTFQQLKSVEERLAEYTAMLKVLKGWRQGVRRSLWLAECLSPHLATWKEFISREHLVLNALEIHDGVIHWSEDDARLVEEICIHAINNCLEHGFIFPRKRGQTLPAVTLKVVARRLDAMLQLEVIDNGAGLDTAALEDVARARNFVPQGDQTLADVVFMDGVSTAETITLSSGRGVGLAAVRQRIDERRGRIRLLPGQPTGSILRAEWPGTDGSRS